jgi:hypothetical protein
LGICSQPFCRVFVCADIHMNHHTGWIWDLELYKAWVQFRWSVSRYT